jgi:hypothetical protein
MTGVAGEMPQELGNLTELNWLELRGSDLAAGPVPDSIRLCTKLTVVILINCQLKGQFPIGLRNLKSTLGMPISKF